MANIGGVDMANKSPCCGNAFRPMASDMAGAVHMAAGQSLASKAEPCKQCCGVQNKAFGVRGGYAASRLEPRMH